MKKIQYSVCMMSSNPAEKNSEKKAYAKLQLTGIVNIDELADHITSHNSVFSPGTVVGVLKEMSKCIRELLQQGYKIQLGQLGALAPAITCNGTDTMEAFTAQDITSMHVNFTAGTALKDLRHNAEFEKTSSRAAQAATLAAQVAGRDTVDISNKDSSSGGNNGGDVTGGDDQTE